MLRLRTSVARAAVSYKRRHNAFSRRCTSRLDHRVSSALTGMALEVRSRGGRRRPTNSSGSWSIQSLGLAERQEGADRDKAGVPRIWGAVTPAGEEHSQQLFWTYLVQRSGRPDLVADRVQSETVGAAGGRRQLLGRPGTPPPLRPSEAADTRTAPRPGRSHSPSPCGL